MTKSNEPGMGDRVALGAAWLDEVSPGWHGVVDLEVLEMSDPEKCVLGQVFAEEDEHPYTYGLERLTIDTEADVSDEKIRAILAIAHGFESSTYKSGSGSVEYAFLRGAWFREVINRRIA